MTAHVFIVDEATLPLHLRYQFAGTGALAHSRMDFNGAAKTKFHHSTENMLVGMIADVSRVRPGDRVIFYLQQKGKEEGRFYGMFRAASSAFLDNDDKRQFLRGELGKSLTFRVRIEADEVYPQGVTEWHALDEIRHIRAPYQMLWSLIYRKLKGNRGCTMITPYEEDALCGLIREQSDRKPLSCKGRVLDLDSASREIVVRKNSPSEFAYTGGAEEFSLFPRIAEKDSRGQKFEAHLQGYIVGQFGIKGDSLSRILLGNAEPEWLGNEVSCGVGMQKIDLMVSYTDDADKVRHVMPIELKSAKASADNLRQIQRYVDWIRQYYIPNRRSVISPVLIAKAAGEIPADFAERVRCFNAENAGDICKPLRMVEFSVNAGRIDYQERDFY